jgi:hypothetical protein
LPVTCASTSMFTFASADDRAARPRGITEHARRLPGRQRGTGSARATHRTLMLRCPPRRTPCRPRPAQERHRPAARRSRATEASIDKALRDVRLLLEADVDWRSPARSSPAEGTEPRREGRNPGLARGPRLRIHPASTSSRSARKSQELMDRCVLAKSGHRFVMLAGSRRRRHIAAVAVLCASRGAGRCWWRPTSIGPRPSTS